MTDRLDSWKEIAAYLRKSVRTARRWESEESLPVHRHVHQSHGTVYAYKTELDAWQRSRTRVARPTVTAAGTAERSIAVLPLVDLSGERAPDYLADGLTEEIIGGLSKVRSLRVISSTSSMTLKGSKKAVRAIGRELGVGFVLEGTVRRAGNRLRVSARLIDVSADDPIWSERYEGTVEDVFEIQEKLARTIVDSLELQLTVDEDHRLSSRPLENVHAYECYIQARQEAYRWRRDSIDHAVQLLENGLRIVGDNAELYASLGRTHLQYRESGIDFSDRPLAEAERCAARAAEIDPGSEAGATLRGWIHYARGNIQEAVRELKTALSSEWGNADVLALLSNCYLISGRVENARPLIARLLTIDPLTPLSRCMPGYADLMDGRLTAAVDPYREMFEMDAANPMARLFYVWVLGIAGQNEEAVEVAARTPAPLRESVPGGISAFLGESLSGNAAGDPPVLSPEVIAIAGASEMFARFLAHGYAWRGLADEATHWLSVAVDRGFINYPFLAEHDPAFRPLRASPSFAALLENVRARWESFEV